MAINPPLPYSVYKQMAEQERFEALQELVDNAKSQADAANRQVIALEQQLTFIKLEAESAKKRRCSPSWYPLQPLLSVLLLS